MTGTTPPTTPPAGTPHEPAAPHQVDPYAAPYAPYPAAPKTNTLAIVSFVSAFFIGIVAIITGHIALGQIRERGEGGRVFALLGLILGYVGTALIAITVVLSVLFAATFATMFATIMQNGGGVTASDSPSALPDGQVGAVNFDQGYIELGTGPVVVDQFFDPLCPYCKLFDETNAPQLALGVDNNAITLRLRALTFLDRASNGSEYSSRAAAALTCEAMVNPDTTLDYLAALYANQPEEGTSGLTDTELIALSTGSTSIESCVTSGDYQAWSQFNTDAAFAGDYANLEAIEGTPAVFVDGELYSGPIDNANAFSQFVASAFDQ